MEAVYSWVKNIIYYMIFLSVVNNLLADSKYEKYIRFFAGMVLILLVVSPLTGKLRLDEQISTMFRTISLENDTDDLKSKLWEMDDKRLGSMMEQYEETVEQDVAAMAAAEGLVCVDAKVRIDSDRGSGTYGQVTDIQMQLQDKNEKKAAGDLAVKGAPSNTRAAGADCIQVEPVELGTNGREETVPADHSAFWDAAPSSGKPETQDAPAPKDTPDSHGDSNKIISQLTGKVAQYYGMEESHIKVRWKDD